MPARQIRVMMCWHAKSNSKNLRLKASWKAAAVWGRACVGSSRLVPLSPQREGVRDDMTHWKYCSLVITGRSSLFFSVRFGLPSSEAAKNKSFWLLFDDLCQWVFQIILQQMKFFCFKNFRPLVCNKDETWAWMLHKYAACECVSGFGCNVWQHGGAVTRTVVSQQEGRWAVCMFPLSHPWIPWIDWCLWGKLGTCVGVSVWMAVCFSVWPCYKLVTSPCDYGIDSSNRLCQPWESWYWPDMDGCDVFML